MSYPHFLKKIMRALFPVKESSKGVCILALVGLLLPTMIWGSVALQDDKTKKNQTIKQQDKEKSNNKTTRQRNIKQQNNKTTKQQDNQTTSQSSRRRDTRQPPASALEDTAHYADHL